MTKPISLQKYKFQLEQKRLEKIMRERYGTVEKEWEAFLMSNGEPEHTETRCVEPLRELEKGLRKGYKVKPE